MHLWHDLSAGSEAPEIVNAILEISMKSKVKYELDKETGLLCVDRILSSPSYYPANYGFIPQSLCDDKDPLDIFVLCTEVLQPFSLVKARPIGVIKMIDKGELDDKIIAVLEGDPMYKHVKELTDIPQYQVDELRVFLEQYKTLEKKKVEITGVLGKADAFRIIKESFDLYKSQYQK